MTAITTQDSSILRFTTEDPCPICGGHPDDPRGNGTRCFGFFSGDSPFAHCSREEFANGLQQHENSKTYSHLLVGDCKCGQRHGEPVGQRRIVATYDYTDIRGNLIHQTVRYSPKDFSQRRPSEARSGGWEWTLKDTRRVLYRLPDVVRARLEGETIFVVEGEKDADVAREELGIVATTCAEGAKKWKPEYNAEFQDVDVVLLPDNDSDGREHMSAVGTELVTVARSVRMLELTGLEEHGDLSDWVANGGTREALDDLVKGAQLFSAETYREGISAESYLPFKTGAEIAAETPALTEWTCFPYFAKGTVTELSGKIKISGKTTFLTHCVSKILDGAPFMGGHTKKTKVLYLTEQPPNSFRKVLRQAKLERDDIKVLYWHDVNDVPWKELMRKVGEVAREYGANVIVIDVISRWVAAAGLEETSPAYADAAMPPLKELAAQGYTVIYARHDRKAGGDVGESGRGTSQLGGDADQLLQLSVPPGGNNRPNVRTLSAIGRFMDQTPHSVNIELVNGEYRSLGSGQDFAKAHALQIIPEILPATLEAAVETDEVIRRVAMHGVKRTACKDALKTLREAGAIECLGTGKKADPRRYYRPGGEEKKDSAEIPSPIVSAESNSGNLIGGSRDNLIGGSPVLVHDVGGLEEMVSTLDSAPEIGVDLETYPRDETAKSLDPRRGHVGVVTLSDGDHTFVLDRKNLDAGAILEALDRTLQDKPIIAHNSKFDLAFLRRSVGYEHNGPCYDTLILDGMLHYATGPLSEKGHWRGFTKRDKEAGYYRSLADVARNRLDLEIDKEEQSSDWGGELNPEMISYAATDAVVLLPLKDAILSELDALGMSTIVDIESRCTPAMVYASDNGLGLDLEAFTEHADEADRQLQDAKAECDELAPELPEDLEGEWAWSGSNHRKVGQALKMLGAKVEKRDSGNYRTDEAALKAIKSPKRAKELAQAILRYRALDRYVTHYGRSWFRLPEVAKSGKRKGKVKKGFPDHKMIVGDRVYSAFNQLVASGRGSSRWPNLQNVPEELHRLFVAPAGRKLLKADYQQLEYVCAAVLSGDEALLEPLRRAEDFHDATAAMLGVERSVAKMVNFATLYGMGKKTLASRLGVTQDQADDYLEALRDRAPDLAAWCDEQTDRARLGTPYATTRLGRIRLLDQKFSRYWQTWGSSASQMLNHPIQGACADGYKLAAAMFWERRREFMGDPLLVNMVHDELDVETDELAAQSDAVLLEEIMVEAMRIAIGEEAPVRVDVEIRDRWG